MTIKTWLQCAALSFAILLSAGAAFGQTAWIPQSGGTLARIDTATDTLVAGTTPIGGNAYGIVATPTRVYVASPGGTVTVINAVDGSVIANISVPNAFGLALSRDGSRLLVGVTGGSNSVAVINTNNNTVVGTLTGAGAPNSVEISPDGTTAYIVNQLGGTVTARTIATDALLTTYSGFSGPRHAVLSADGSKLYVSNSNSNTVSVLTLAGGAVVNVPVGNLPWGVAISPDGSAVYVANFLSGTVSRIVTATNAVTTAPAGSEVIGVSTSADGQKLYATNRSSGTVSVYNATTLAPITTITGLTQPQPMGQFIARAAQPQAPAPVPTLSEWAMILFGTILAGGAALYIQRRRLTA